jgi:hypothetical protein
VKFFMPADLAQLEDPGLLRIELQLVGHEVDALAIAQWTPAERLLAHDYAVRVRMHVDVWGKKLPAPAELRPCPSFVLSADVHRGEHSFWWQLTHQGEIWVAS